MLEEAQQLKQQGHDVVLGYFEPHGRQDTIAKIEGLELIPGNGSNTAGIFRRDEYGRDPGAAAEICAVDEFPHTNVPGSPRGSAGKM